MYLHKTIASVLQVIKIGTFMLHRVALKYPDIESDADNLYIRIYIYTNINIRVLYPAWLPEYEDLANESRFGDTWHP